MTSGPQLSSWKRRRRCRDLLATAIALSGLAITLAVATPKTGSAATRLACNTSGKTIRSNALARVFRVRARDGHVYYGCVRGAGHVHRLARTRIGVLFLDLPRLTGRYFAATPGHIDSHESGVEVWDLATGTSSAWYTGREEYTGGDIEVTANGAVSWITEGNDVWKADADGLAKIGTADFRSRQWKTLTRAGERVYWRDKGALASYLLRGAATDASTTGWRWR